MNDLVHVLQAVEGLAHFPHITTVELRLEELDVQVAQLLRTVHFVQLLQVLRNKARDELFLEHLEGLGVQDASDLLVLTKGVEKHIQLDNGVDRVHIHRPFNVVLMDHALSLKAIDPLELI